MDYGNKLEKLRNKFFDDTAGLVWSYRDDKNEDAGAAYIMVCVGLLEEIAQIIKKQFRLKTKSPDEVFRFLYTSKKVEKDYSELYLKLVELEDSIDYGRLSIKKEGEFSLEENSAEIEEMIDALIALEK